jgi:diguanylate cyclase (GGDEF)-like protein
MKKRAMMDKDFSYNKSKTPVDLSKWCRYIVNAGHATAALIILAHVIWYFAARSVLGRSADVYLRNYIIFPAIGFGVLNTLVDKFVRSARFSLTAKEYLSLSLFIIFSFYLSSTHDIAKVLLCSYILPIFASTIFSNIKITRWIFLMSVIAVLLLGVKIYIAGNLDDSMLMQIFVACFMFLCSYLLAKILIRYGHDNLAALTNYNDQQRHMQEQLMLDPFTGLYNRKTFDDYLAKSMEECKSINKCLSLAMIDVDHFKHVNDLFGHAAGDRALLYLSQLLKDIQADNIHAFRIGGDEFAVLFRDCDGEEACRVCENVRTQMKSASLHNTDHHQVTFSCGLVYAEPRNTSAEALMAAADSALYAAKHNGRNQVVIYNDPMLYINQNQEDTGHEPISLP